ncbi:MAG TPA: methionyl-tRNA formyltransferase [Candidatus Dormibacteraeota bacterium]|nr:methionyl-tRNA formyltransferase [Candidatus Dormibacteraeota bacterium]
MRIVFCGTPEFAVPALRHLLSQPEHRIEAVVTQPDRPRGRGGNLAPSPVKQVALEAGLPVFQPQKSRSDEAYQFFQRVAPDVVVIVAYGQIIPARLLAIPRFGWINLHASLLPKYRGAAPINWAIASGETRTGLTTMRIDAGLDTGDMLLQVELPIGSDETAPELAVRMAETGAPLVAETLRKLEHGELSPKPQDHAQASLAPILKKEDGRIDWLLSAEQIYARIRGFAPWPGAFTTFRGQLCHLWGRPGTIERTPEGPGTVMEHDQRLVVQCGRNFLELESVQLEGRKRIAARDFANGARLLQNERFG